MPILIYSLHSEGHYPTPLLSLEAVPPHLQLEVFQTEKPKHCYYIDLQYIELPHDMKWTRPYVRDIRSAYP